MKCFAMLTSPKAGKDVFMSTYIMKLLISIKVLWLNMRNVIVEIMFFTAMTAKNV